MRFENLSKNLETKPLLKCLEKDATSNKLKIPQKSKV